MKNLKNTITLLIVILSTFILPISIYADIGPKDKLTVYVKNPPTETYYLDLLTQKSKPYDNFHTDGERETLNPKMLKLLYSYKNDGWMPALTEGTGVPIFGHLVGIPYIDKMIHTFGYIGVPDTYRIIIVTKEGKVVVSDPYSRKALQSSITFDYKTGKAIVPPIWISYLAQFATTCIPTLIIELFILLLFGFNLKYNIKIFLFTNLLTQVLMTTTLGTTLIIKGSFSAYLIQFPVELIILIIETILYIKLLNGHTARRRCIYGITANIASWAIGFCFLSFQYQFLVSLI